MLPDHINDTLRSIYYNPNNHAGFASIEKLYSEAKLKDTHVSRQDVRNWLASEMTYSLHAPSITNFPRNRCVVQHIDEQWQADLVDMTKFKSKNNNMSFILTVIDMFSKFAFVVPLKNKSGASLRKAFKQIFDKGRKPIKLQTDKGTEFTNKLLQSYLAEEKVHFFTTTNTNTVVERLNRTIKTKMFKYLTANNTKRYIDVLDSFINAYNRSKHRTTKMRPIDVTPYDAEEEEFVFRNTYGVPTMTDLLQQSSKRKDLFEMGDEVRIALIKKAFTKGYKPQWSKEIYRVVNCIHRIDRNVYEICNKKTRKLLRKKFYPEELSKVTVNLSSIKQVIRSRPSKVAEGAKQYLVELESDGEKKWIPEEDLPPPFKKYKRAQL